MRIMKQLFYLILLLSPFIGYTQIHFPKMEGYTLEDEKIVLPDDTKGKYTLIGLAFSKKTDEDLRTWLQPAYSTFISPPKNSLIPVDDYDVNIVFIAMLKGVASTASGKIVKKMKEGIDPILHPYLMIYEGGIGPYKTSLAFGAKNVPYFYILDDQGAILYHTQGEYTEEKFEEILEFFED